MTALPTTFGKYRLLRLIATGGMGEVFLAKLVGPSGFEKLVVIKRLLADRVGDPKYTEMFFAEARVQAQLSHGNIVAVHEVGEQDGLPYIAMEYVRGRSLKRVLERAKQTHREETQSDQLLRPVLPAAYLVYIFAAVARGLKSAHEARHLSGAVIDIVHRDINPHNVLVTYQGEVKVIDFGIAKSEMTTDKTKVGTIKGTVVYMSPEQASGLPLDGRSDQFSVGICLYEALLGYNPFHRKTIVESLEAIRTVDYPRDELLLERVAGFAPIVSRCLAQHREARFADCGELEEALVRLIATNTVVEAKEHFDVFLAKMLAKDIADDERLLGQTDKILIDSVMGRAQVLATSEEMTRVTQAPRTLASQPEMREEPTNPRGSAPPELISAVVTVPSDPPLQPARNEAALQAHGIEPAVEQASSPPTSLSPKAVAEATGAPPAFSIEMVLGDELLPTERVALEPGAAACPADDAPHTQRRIWVALGAALALALAGLYTLLRPHPAPVTLPLFAGASSVSPPADAFSAFESAKNNKNRTALIFFSWGPSTQEISNLPGSNDEAAARAETTFAENVGARGRPRGLRPLAMRLNVDPPQDVRYRGVAIKSSFRLHETRGVFEIGHPGGADPGGFYVHIAFRRYGRHIFYEVTTEPWADVFLAGGMALGRTPLAEFEGLGTTSFTLRNPKISEPWTLTLGVNNATSGR